MIASRLFVAMVLCSLCAAQASPLWDYVNEPDDTFQVRHERDVCSDLYTTSNVFACVRVVSQWVDTGYRLRPPNSTAKKDQWTGYLLNVTSQVSVCASDAATNATAGPHMCRGLGGRRGSRRRWCREACGTIS